MIDRSYDFSISRQAQVLNISRGNGHVSAFPELVEGFGGPREVKQLDCDGFGKSPINGLLIKPVAGLP
jgi:hypothetical protein